MPLVSHMVPSFANTISGPNGPTDVQINFTSNGSTWIGLFEITITDSEGTARFTNLAAVNSGSGNDFITINVGEFTADSSYQTQSYYLNDGNTTSNTFWSSTSSSDINVYIKFNSPIDIKNSTIEIWWHASYANPTLNVTDIDNNTYSPSIIKNAG